MPVSAAPPTTSNTATPQSFAPSSKPCGDPRRRQNNDPQDRPLQMPPRTRSALPQPGVLLHHSMPVPALHRKAAPLLRSTPATTNPRAPPGAHQEKGDRQVSHHYTRG